MKKTLCDELQRLPAIAAFGALAGTGGRAGEPIVRERGIVDERREERRRESGLEEVEEISLEAAAFVGGDDHVRIGVLARGELHHVHKALVAGDVLGPHPRRLQNFREVRAVLVERPAEVRTPPLHVRDLHRGVGMRDEVVVERLPRAVPEPL